VLVAFQGLTMAEWLYSAFARTGTFFGTFAQSSGIGWKVPAG
jgi:hypothetical protein